MFCPSAFIIHSQIYTEPMNRLNSMQLVDWASLWISPTDVCVIIFEVACEVPLYLVLEWIDSHTNQTCRIGQQNMELLSSAPKCPCACCGGGRNCTLYYTASPYPWSIHKFSWWLGQAALPPASVTTRQMTIPMEFSVRVSIYTLLELLLL